MLQMTDTTMMHASAKFHANGTPKDANRVHLEEIKRLRRAERTARLVNLQAKFRAWLTSIFNRLTRDSMKPVMYR